MTDITHESARFLRLHPGHAFCDSCLASRLAISVSHIRNVRVALTGTDEFEQETAFCSVCLTLGHTIHLAWLRFRRDAAAIVRGD